MSDKEVYNNLQTVQSTGQIPAKELSHEERLHRALILDSKLEDALLESYQYMAEIVDHKLYIELGFTSAKDYFQTKRINVSQLYVYAQIGREFKPYLSDPKHKETFKRLGTSKIGLIASKLSDQIDPFMQGGTIEIGDEVYTVEDINNSTVKQIEERLKALSKKLEKTELLEEQKKSLELENKAILKKLDEAEARDAKYREISETEAQIEADLNEASKAWERVQVLLYRINSIDAPTHLQTKLVDTIRTIQRGTDRISEQHAEVLIIHEDAVI